VLRFFRKYFLNKYVLVFLGVVLMAVFGLDRALQGLFQGSGPSLGTVHGHAIRIDDERQAVAELRLLSRFPLMGQMVNGMLAEGYDPTDEDSDDSPALRWILIQADAERLGLQASQTQIDALLQVMGATPENLQSLAASAGTPVAAIEQTVGKFIVMLDYADLVAGRSLARDTTGGVEALTPQSRRFALLMAAMQQQQQGRFEEAFGMQLMAGGAFRLSDAVLASAALASRAAVAGGMVVLYADDAVDPDATPDPDLMQELFDDYRDDLPGQSEPFGLGYRTPDRVKLEYLEFPIDAVADAIDIDEADALAWFRQNRDAVREALGQPDADYAAARDLVFRRLRDQQAQAKALDIIREVQGDLTNQLRPVMAADGYPRPDADLDPTPLRVIADRIEAEHGIRPDVNDFTANWLPANQLSRTGTIASTTVAGRTNAPFGDYVRSVRELGELEVENPAAALRPLRLAVGTPSQPMLGPDGSAYLFRVTDAQPARSPESIDEVRDQLTVDARRIAAYRQLVEQTDDLRRLAAEEGLEGVAAEYGSSVREVPPMPRRMPLPMGPVPPRVPGLSGNPEAVVDAMHATARDALAGQAESLDAVPPADRVGVAPSPGSFAVAVFRVDDYQTLTREQFDRFRRDPVARFLASAELSPLDADSPLSFTSLARRTGFDHDDD